MDILTFKVKAILTAVVAAALVLLVLWYGEWRADAARAAESQKWELAAIRQKAQAAQILGAETRKVLEKERLLNAAQSRIEEMGRERTEIAQGYETRLAAAAARNAGRLHDPNAAGCRGGGAGAQDPVAARAGDRAQDGAEAGGLLSAQLTGLLQRLTREADAINDAYAVCKPDTVNLRRQLSPSP